MVDFVIKQDALLPVLKFTITDANGVPIDLTGGQVTFRMRNARTGVLKVNNSGTITNGAGGAGEYPWVTGDTDTPGVYEAEVLATLASGKLLIVPVRSYRRILVEARIPA